MSSIDRSIKLLMRIYQQKIAYFEGMARLYREKLAILEEEHNGSASQADSKDRGGNEVLEQQHKTDVKS